MHSANATWRPDDRNTEKGEVGGSSPPRPTIKIISKYTAIFTIPLSGNISQKSDLPTSRLAGWPYTRGVQTSRAKAEGLASPRRVENAALSCRRTCKAVQDTARLWKE